MKKKQNRLGISQNSFSFLLLFALASLSSPGKAAAQGQLTLANPHWNITLTDFGYSDYLLDNTPGFEGREYLSGEWAAAVGYQLAGSPPTTPQWLEAHFVYPDWTNNSTFHASAPLTQTGLNADGLPIAQSIITNNDLEITLRHEMLDTVVGIPMGTKPASAIDAGTFINSDRYVLKQTCTIRNISGSTMSNVQFFQFLHGLNSQRGSYDDRLYAGPLSEFRYDVTQAGVDAAAAGAGSSAAGLEDFIGFHSAVAPSAFEIGYYGIEGNGVDDHFSGKPSDGVHLSVEDNWQTIPYSTREGTDAFTPVQRWVAGAARWSLGNLTAGQSVNLDVLLTVLTGTKVTTGTGSSGGCNGGSRVPGGVDYEFEDVTSEGSCFGEYSKADEAEIAVRIAEGEFGPFTFFTPGAPEQLWELEFSGTYSGTVQLSFAYDPTLLPGGFDQSALRIYQFNGSGWEELAGVVSPTLHTITVTTTRLSAFALGVDSGVTFNVSVSASPTDSGAVTGGGPYADGSSATLVASAAAGYAFTNWTENAVEVSASPSYTFIVEGNRTLVANFLPVGDGSTVTTSSLPSNGGSTSGDGSYAPRTSVTVVASPNAGYKFSKWLLNGAIVSTARSYSFTITDDCALVAKFKPVYTIITSPEPAAGGEIDADTLYEFGDPAVLKAKPSLGYAFVNWTQNGTTVSTEATYIFTVTGNRELVAHFALGYAINVTAQPANAGTASGGGIYAPGADVTVEAIANPGYVFLNWTENGTVVCTTPTYTFVSDAGYMLVANFVAQPALSMALSAPDLLVISWPAGANGWALQESPDLTPESWVDSTRTVTVVGNQKQVIVSPPTGNAFFRLVHP